MAVLLEFPEGVPMTDASDDTCWICDRALYEGYRCECIQCGANVCTGCEERGWCRDCDEIERGPSPTEEKP